MRAPTTARGDRHRFLSGAASVALLLAAWESLAAINVLNSFFLPPPSTLVATFWELIGTGFPEGIGLGVHVWKTLNRILIGFAVAVGTAIPLGLLIGYFRDLEVATRGLFAFGRSIAPISILPLVIAWFGIGEESKIALIIFASFWATITNTIAGVRFVDPTMVRAAQALGARQSSMFLRVVLPAALPRIFAGVKVSLAIAFMVIVAAEMIATIHGLGALINEARNWFRTDITIVGMLVIGVLGVLASFGLDRFERWLVPWGISARVSE